MMSLLRRAGLFSVALIAGSTGAATPSLAAATGAQIYAESCAACHMPAGQGVKGAFPALARSPFVQGDQTKLVSVVLNGRGGMPAFNGDLTPEQLAAVLTYMRSSWGNKATPIGKGLVASIKAKSGQATSRRALEAH